MNYKENYKEQSKTFEQQEKICIDRKSEQNAYNYLNLRENKSEVFKLQGYFEGDFIYTSEDKNTHIEISWDDTAGVNLHTYMTLKDLMDVDNDIAYIEISFWEHHELVK